MIKKENQGLHCSIDNNFRGFLFFSSHTQPET